MSYYSLQSEYINIFIQNGFIQDRETGEFYNIRYLRKFSVKRAYGDNYHEDHKIYAQMDGKDKLLVGTVSQFYCPDSTLERLIMWLNSEVESITKHFDKDCDYIVPIPPDKEPRKSNYPIEVF